ncbi:threonine aldolase family protein [Kitasatospora sp. NPDC001683]
MTDDQIDWGRLRAARRASTRFFSGSRPLTIHERLTTLAAAVDPGLYPDVYGNGGPVGELEERTAALLGTQDAVFFPTGTMAQQVALRYHAERTGNRAVALHPLSHIERHERHAHTQLTGLRGLWPTTAQRQPTPEELRSLGEPFGTVVVELPLRDPGFLLPSWEELTELVAAARETGARVHFDGARLWNTTAHFGKPLDEIAALADSVYVSYYKDLGGISGAALAGDETLTAYARTWRHRYGGQLYQQWPAALSALAGWTPCSPSCPVTPPTPRHSSPPWPPSPAPASTRRCRPPTSSSSGCPTPRRP